ncbi:tripartite-type tricarboxylate transporter receptor subunit TctC [Variovorax boronicumulans]|uniref:Bug family tripartite tricarboxylate transporter substrate binding protein n=1 Tax=Variovorax boronicumulans TaxID=436515 RepID=UPI00277E5534|nr:tripartite tricarboxylate transporter substrate binding protein [Variovorax boronicumulans]MDP9994013.1 tripartite-type tricarboxylate transporter receptor subunit TctC [Variovorax boronicumulans]MDQ0005124.1 tripartite-type tricarboxylate transporter receptor subunit TctC [Variovorax boronicumulans]
MNTRIGRRQAFFLAVGLVLGQADAHAQVVFPTRPITMIVGWPAGGPADNVARVIAAQMSSALGQPIVIDNRPGAGGNIGSELAARSKPDGYTIMLATVASHGWNPALYSNLGYKPVEDFAPVGLINTSPGTLLVSVNSPYKTVGDLVEAARKQPGKLNYGSGGVGSSQHMAAAMFKKLAGIDVTHIPFKGTAPAMTELMAGRVDMIITTGAIPFVRSGKLRALAVAAHQRLPALPNVPTFEQAGVRNFYTDNWYGLAAPANTPRPILESLNAALAKALANPEVQKQFVEQGAFPSKPQSVDDFWGFVEKQMPQAAELVRSSGAKLE